MEMKALTGLGCAFAMAATAAQASGGAHWGYQGSEGPDNWHRLSSGYLMCGTGQHQSPVNISQFTPFSSTTIEARYRPSTLFILNNGHTVQENFIPGSGLVSNGHEYGLVQVHFHTPSEHAISGKRYPLEAHFVHADAENKLAVVGVFFEIGEPNVELAKIISAAPHHAEPTRRYAGVQVNPLGLLPAKLDAYNYMGSLTTPPCTEEVNWHVVKQVMTASAEQIEAMHAILGDNARPIQTEQMAMMASPVVQDISAAMSDHAAHAPAARKDETAHTQMAVASQGH
jgi:carbonic anhydrase